MTTFELNLRKADLFDMIKSMDEESFSKAEKLIKQLCSHKTKEVHPYALPKEELSTRVNEAREDIMYGRSISTEELLNIISESEEDYKNGHFITQDALATKLRKKIASW